MTDDVSLPVTATNLIGGDYVPSVGNSAIKHIWPLLLRAYGDGGTVGAPLTYS